MELWRGARFKNHFDTQIEERPPAQVCHWERKADKSAMFNFWLDNNERASQYGVIANFEDAMTILKLISNADPRAAELLGDPQDQDAIKQELGLL
jgi:hypothetical protein